MSGFGVGPGGPDNILGGRFEADEEGRWRPLAWVVAWSREDEGR